MKESKVKVSLAVNKGTKRKLKRDALESISFCYMLCNNNCKNEATQTGHWIECLILTSLASAMGSEFIFIGTVGARRKTLKCCFITLVLENYTALFTAGANPLLVWVANLKL